MRIHKCIWTFISIILVHQLSAFKFADQCYKEISQPVTVTINKVTGKQQLSSFGQPISLETRDSESNTKDITMYDLRKLEESKAAENEYEIVSRLAKKTPFNVVPIDYCTVFTFADGSAHTVLFFRRKLAVSLQSTLVHPAGKRNSINVRAISYSNMAHLVNDLHKAKVAHCNVQPSAFVSNKPNYNSLQIANFRYATDAQKGTCPGNAKSYKPYDIDFPECSNPENVLKADTWNLAVSILLLEDEMNGNDIKYLMNSSSGGETHAAFACFFDPADIDECRKTIRRYISEVVKKRYSLEGKSTLFKDYTAFGKIIAKAFLGCEERISAEEMYNELLTLGFKMEVAPQKAAPRPIPNYGTFNASPMTAINSGRSSIKSDKGDTVVVTSKSGHSVQFKYNQSDDEIKSGDVQVVPQFFGNSRSNRKVNPQIKKI